jgi:2-keto-myo-inositol isomerase
VYGNISRVKLSAENFEDLSHSAAAIGAEPADPWPRHRNLPLDVPRPRILVIIGAQLAWVPELTPQFINSDINIMQNEEIKRRQWLTQSTVMAAAGCLASPALRAQAQPLEPTPVGKFRFCLNMSTINGGEVDIREQLKIAAEAGYDSVELWLRDIERFTKAGGDLTDLRNEIRDLGLAVDSSIAFGKWIVDDDNERAVGLEQAKRDMDTIRHLGGRRIAAPPVGATDSPGLDLNAAGERYRKLLEIGSARDVVPQIELWGFSKNLATLAEVLYVAAAANHPDACVLLDIYHMYKGGSDFSNIGLVPGAKMHCLHMNDYPAEPPRPEIGDKDRVYPGDGVAPIKMILSTLVKGGFNGTLSLELFNRTYWAQPPRQVAKLGLEKMKAAVA